MYKVFFNDRLIKIKEYTDEPDEESFIYKCNTKLNTLIDFFLESEKPDEICFEHDNLEVLFNKFTSYFKIIEAAGGLVFNNKKEFLLITRWDKPDLPKGKIEKGEDTKTAAIREVVEECGIEVPEIIKELPATYHIYFGKKNTILKKTYWFEMKYTGTKIPVPQTEEAISEVRFVENSKALELSKKSYRNLEDLFQYAYNK